jgi:cytochrome b561
LKECQMSLSVSERYTTPAIVLHWAIAALIAGNLLLAWSFGLVPADGLRTLIDIHKSIGITVLGLAILRVLWRATHAPPPLPAGPAWESTAAHTVHWILYGLIFLLPISGWMHDSAWKGAAGHPVKLFFVIPWFRIGAIEHLAPLTKEYWHSLLFKVHLSLAYVLYGMFVAHVAGALKHQFLEGKPELQRMWPAIRRNMSARPSASAPARGATPTGARP